MRAIDKVNGEFITDLSFLAPVRIDGADAAGFLHGQFTTDVAELVTGGATFSAWCDPRGRTVATFILSRLDDRFWLLLPDALRETFVRRLKMYVLRAEVNIVDMSGGTVCAGIVDAPAEKIMAIFPGLEVNRDRSVVRHDGYILISYPDNVMIVLAEMAETAALRDTCQTHLPGADSRAWETDAIRQGIPWLVAETSGRFLPQELNLDSLGALSYSKGCYPGQEIIARLRYRGKVKRRLCYATTENRTLLKPGAGLILTGEEKNIGAVVNSAVAGPAINPASTVARQELLIVLEHSLIESGPIVAKDFPDYPINVKNEISPA